MSIAQSTTLFAGRLRNRHAPAGAGASWNRWASLLPGHPGLRVQPGGGAVPVGVVRVGGVEAAQERGVPGGELAL